MDVSEGASDVSLLLGLSEEVLVHLVKVGRFTLTDIGHLRASCKCLCDFFDRIRDTVVNDNVVGDLSQYRPYGHWDIDLAAQCGHLEVIKLLHEDEVKRGRATHCSNKSIKVALECHDWGMFEFLVRNRPEVFPDDVPGADWYGISGGFKNASRGQLLFLLDEAPSFLASSSLLAAIDAARSAIQLGDAALVRRLLPYVQRPATVADSALYCSSESDQILNIVLDDYKSRHADERELTARLLHPAAETGSLELLDKGLLHAPLSVNEISYGGKSFELDYAVREGHMSVALRLREMGAKCEEAFGSRDEITRFINEDGAKVCLWTLVTCLRRGDYDAAEFVVPQLNGVELDHAAQLLLRYGAMDGLRWMKKKQLLGSRCMELLDGSSLWDSMHIPSDLVDKVPKFVPTCEAVEFVITLMREEKIFQKTLVHEDPWEVRVAKAWYAPAIARGDLNVLRYLCESVNILRVFSHRGACAAQGADAAVAAGHTDVVVYMMDVNARAVPVRNSALHPKVFHLVKHPFNLSNALETAVRAGRYELVRMIDRRLPGLSASLAAAVHSRRWRLCRWVIDRSPSAISPDKVRTAFLAAVLGCRLEFVRWFEECHPDVVASCVPDIKFALVKVRDMSIFRAILERHPTAFCYQDLSQQYKMPVAVSYDTFVVEQLLGVELVRRPLRVSDWAEAGRRDVLQAAIDFHVPLHRPYATMFDPTSPHVLRNPPLVEWFRRNDEAGKFNFTS